MARALITMPRSARAGEVIEIRALLSHPMETGQRTDPEGRLIPRDIVTRFSCRCDGELVFSADMDTPVAVNPYLAFHAVALATGTFDFAWDGDNGFRHHESRTLTVA